MNEFFNSAWGRTSSRHSTEILWSRDKDDLFPERETDSDKRRFSHFDETCSSSSWGFDDFEAKSVENIAASLDAIDEALYEGKNSSLNQELFDECQKWSKAYPHLRLLGKHITPALEYNPDGNGPSSRVSDSEIGVSSIQSKNSKILNASSDVFQLDVTDEENCRENSETDYIEEIVCQDGEYDDNFSASESHEFDCDKESSQSYGEIGSFPLNQLKECVLDQLSMKIWGNVISRLSKLNQIHDKKRNERLPPITVSSEYSHHSYVSSKLKSGTAVADFPRLDGVLTVAPKVLLPKSESRAPSRAEAKTRPSTGWSVSSRSSIGSGSSGHCAQRNFKKDIKRNFQLNELKKITEQDIDLLHMYLPVVKEDNPVWHSGIQGLHIEPETKKPPKLISYGALNFVEKPQNFLPPIDDRDQTTFCDGNVKTTQYALSYKPHQQSGNSHNRCIYARHLNGISSRPSTSRNAKEMNISELRRVKEIPLCNTGKELEGRFIKNHLPSYTTSRGNLVNLLPIVTSLEPKQTGDKKKYDQITNKKKL